MDPNIAVLNVPYIMHMEMMLNEIEHDGSKELLTKIINNTKDSTVWSLNYHKAINELSLDDPDLQQKLYDVINDEIERIDYFQNNTSFLNKEAPFIEKFQELIKELFLAVSYTHLVTHDAEVAAVAQRVIHLRDGLIDVYKRQVSGTFSSDQPRTISCAIPEQSERDQRIATHYHSLI